MPRDFLADEGSSPVTENVKGRDFLAEVQPQRESFGASAAYAIPRAATDIATGLYHTAQNIPSYYEEAKSGIPAALHTAMQNPMGALKQAGAGFSELGQNTFNLPHDIANYASNRLNLIPQDINQKIQMGRMPSDTEQMINQTFGSPQNTGEEAIRFGGRNILNAMAAGGIANKLNPMNLTSRNIADNVIKTRNEMLNKYSGPQGLYTSLFNDARNKGLGTVKYDPEKINVDAIKSFANPKFTESLDTFMQAPDIHLAQSAQSDLKKYVSQMNAKSSLTRPEQESLNAAKEAQKHIADKMFEGDEDLKKQYKKITSGYRKEVIPYTTNKAINAFAQGELLPEELIPRLSRGKFAAMRGDAHPEIKWKNRLTPTWQKFAAAGGLGAGAGGVGYLYNALMGNKPQ